MARGIFTRASLGRAGSSPGEGGGGVAYGKLGLGQGAPARYFSPEMLGLHGWGFADHFLVDRHAAKPIIDGVLCRYPLILAGRAPRPDDFKRVGIDCKQLSVECEMMGRT